MQGDSCGFHEPFNSIDWTAIETVLDATPIPVCLLIAGSIFYVNSAFLRLVQAESGRVLAQNFTDLSPCAFAEEISAEGAAGGKGQALVRSSSGELLSVEATAVPVVVQGRRLMQVSLTEAGRPMPGSQKRQLLRQVMSSTRDCVKILGLDGTLRWMNPEGQERIGITDFRQVAGTSWLDFWGGEDREAAVAAIEQARTAGHGRFVGALLTRGGEETWWDTSITPVLAESGKANALLAVSREVTVQRRAEVELNHTSQLLRIIVDRVPAFISYLDAEGRYRWINRSYEEWCGISARDIEGHDWHEVLKDRFGEEYVARLRPYVEAALTGTAVSFEAYAEFDGSRHELLISYSPDWDDAGQVRGFVVLTTDLSEQRRAQEQLQASEERFLTLAGALPSIVWAATPAGELDYISERFRENTGLAPERVHGEAWVEVMHPGDLPAVMQNWQACLQSGNTFESKYRIRQADGSYRWYLGRGLAQRNSAGKIVRWVGVSMDIHQQVMAEQAVLESKQRYKSLFNGNPLPMWTYDPQTLRFLSVNEAAAHTYGHSSEEFLRMRVTDLYPREEMAGLSHAELAAHWGMLLGRVRHRRKDGSLFWAEVAEHTIREGEIATHLVVAQDISERVRLHEELQRRVNHDPLTGLPNRTLLKDRFQQAVSRANRHGRKVALMAIDFDRFKQINDTFGHQTGDEFLVAGAYRIRARLRESDTLARISGDEFMVIAEEIEGLDSGAKVAQGLIDTLQVPIEVGDIELQPTISVGLALYPDDGSDLDVLMRRADYGLYEAKRSGRNCWKRHHRANSNSIEEARRIERSLRKAVEEQRLELHYQPIFSCNGELCAMEALLRLNDPELGQVMPGRFIPIAEESGLIHSVGQWVLREACRQSREWQDQGFKPVPITVNVSAAQLLRGNVVEVVRDALDEFDVEPELLTLELTESLLLENREQSCLQLGILKKIGVRIAVDDFGTGYSSLSYLHTLPLDVLKIDRSFVQTISERQSNPIVKTIVELGKNLGLTVIAEGIETEAQCREVIRLGCYLLQGYLFAKPAPASAMETFFIDGVTPVDEAVA